jgi:hypothetical protein
MPEWAKASAELKGKAKLGNVDATVSPGLAQKFGVNSYPTIKVFPGGTYALSLLHFVHNLTTRAKLRFVRSITTRAKLHFVHNLTTRAKLRLPIPEHDALTRAM